MESDRLRYIIEAITGDVLTQPYSRLAHVSKKKKKSYNRKVRCWGECTSGRWFSRGIKSERCVLTVGEQIEIENKCNT